MKGFLEWLGIATVVLALCIGPPSCCYIVARGEAIKAETKAKLQQLQQLEKENKP